MSQLMSSDLSFYLSQLHASYHCNSLLKKYLTKEILDSLKELRTPFGGTLADIVQSGLANLDSSIGVYATDPLAYQIFRPLLDPILRSYHGHTLRLWQPASDFGSPEHLSDLDPQNKYIMSTRVRCARSIEGYPFNSRLTKNQYKEIEDKVSSVLVDPKTGFEGEYYSLSAISDADRQRLVQDHILFKEGDRFLQAAGACRHWPHGRGIFSSRDKTLVVWVNEEDHLRIISMQKDADLASIYGRLVQTMEILESRVKFNRDKRLGYLTFCPTNIGTTIRASVHIRLPYLSRDMPRLREIAERYGLQIRGTNGEHSQVEDGIYDMSNRRRFGLTEFDALKGLQDGIQQIIKLEEQQSYKQA